MKPRRNARSSSDATPKGSYRAISLKICSGSKLVPIITLIGSDGAGGKHNGKRLVPAGADATARAVALVDTDVIALARAAKSDNTLLAYRKAMKAFALWCSDRGVTSLPAEPEAVAAYLSARMKDGTKASSLTVLLSAIRHFHKAAGFPSPTEHDAVKIVMRGIRRTIGTAPVQKHPATAERLSAMLAHIPADLHGKRDRALLLLGMAGAFRRSELIGLDVEDLTFTEKGMDVTIRRSKTDQEGQGHLVAIPAGESLKPVAAVKAWLEAAGIDSGPLFRAVNKAGRVGDERLSDKIGRQHRQGLCGQGRARPRGVLGPFAAGWLRHQRRRPWSRHQPDHGPDAPYRPAHGAEIHSPRRALQGSRRGRVPVSFRSGEATMKAFYLIAAIAAASPALADTALIPGLQPVPGPSEELAKELVYRAYSETRDACLYREAPPATFRKRTAGPMPGIGHGTNDLRLRAVASMTLGARS